MGVVSAVLIKQEFFGSEDDEAAAEAAGVLNASPCHVTKHAGLNVGSEHIACRIESWFGAHNITAIKIRSSCIPI